jgi:hypothetical protein
MSTTEPKPAAETPIAYPEGPGFVMPRGYTLEEALASVGPGWASLIREVFAALPKQTVIDQVKEKFGLVRIYHEPYRPRFQKLLNAVEARSATICERCGEPGTFDQSFSWIKVLCPTHITERAAEHPARVVETVALVDEMVRQASVPPERWD